MCYALNRTPEELLEDGPVKLTGGDICRAEVAVYTDQAMGTQITVELDMTEEGGKSLKALQATLMNAEKPWVFTLMVNL